MALSIGSKPRSARPDSTACATARYDEQPTGANVTPRRAAYAASTACEYEPSIPSKAAVIVRAGAVGAPGAAWALVIVLSGKEEEPLRRGALRFGPSGLGYGKGHSRRRASH